jgi:hypothetical protein
MRLPYPGSRLLLGLVLAGPGVAFAADVTATVPTVTPSLAALPRSDAHGNPIRRAATGHVSNYDEAKVGDYILPDPLVLANGEPVTTAALWFNRRRAEILELYRENIYGRVPDTAPPVRFTVGATDPQALGGTAVQQEIIAHFGAGTVGPDVHVTFYRPAHAAGPVPLLVHLIFGFGARPVAAASVPAGGTAAAPPRRTEVGPIAAILARGYGYATVRYTEIEPDLAWGAPNRPIGVRALALVPGQTQPAPDEWGTICAWSWGASRLLDYLQTDPAIDPHRIALIGHSRLGKAVIWSGARDPRWALIYSSCAGELGTSLARRDFGETVDDMAANFPWQFAGNLQKYPAHWNDLPVDTHMVIALNAPHPVFIGGGTTDQWTDPRGEFLAEVAAGPVYRLVGKRDLGATTMQVETPLITGDLGFHYHEGGHAITPSDWKAFLAFTDKYFQPQP